VELHTINGKVSSASVSMGKASLTGLNLKLPVEEAVEYPVKIGGKEYAIQGEVVGPGINKCKNKETEYKFLCFRIWDIKNQKWLNPKDTIFFCEKFQIPHVQIVKDDFAFFDEITTMEDALKFAEGKTAEGHEREGIVCKTVDDGPFASFKIVSNKYLMKQED
jgi:ATP-dependent RNA circularization protein (DNA/RNA ligase family)